MKTQKNDGDVRTFLAGIEDDRKRAYSMLVFQMMTEITGEQPQMYGSSIVGFGHYQFENADGKPGHWFVTGFSPRKQSLTLYIMPGFSAYRDLMASLGKHKVGKSFLYVKNLKDLDLAVLKDLICHSVAYMAEKYPAK